MYNWSVRIQADGGVQVAPLGEVYPKRRFYKHIDNVPKEIGDKVKLLMWTPIDGRSEYPELGMRIGANLYWVM